MKNDFTSPLKNIKSKEKKILLYINNKFTLFNFSRKKDLFEKINLNIWLLIFLLFLKYLFCVWVLKYFLLPITGFAIE